MNGSFDATDRSSWYFGNLSRDQATQKLQGKSVGTFLIRRSARIGPDDYVLSVAETEKIANYIIYKEKEHDQYRIGDQRFNDIPQVT
jgi:proto-oncogene C-crk